MAKASTVRGQIRKRDISEIYKKAFGKNPNGNIREISRKLIAKFDIPYVPSKVKMVTFVSQWIVANKPEFAPTLRIKAHSVEAKAKLRRPITTFIGGALKPDVESKEAFYKSWEWRTLRMEALKAHGPRCQCCGAGRGDVDIGGNPVRIVVDHIEPLARRWDLRLTLSNLQILCDECNMGKGAWDQTDWRESA